MRKHGDTASGGLVRLGRLGALAVVLTGVLCGAILSIASRVPPDPVDEGQIPGVIMGDSERGDRTPVVHRERRSEPGRRAGAGASAAPGERKAGRPRGAREELTHRTASGQTRAGKREPAGPAPGRSAPALPGPDTPAGGGGRGVAAPGAPSGGRDYDEVRAPASAAAPDDDPEDLPEPASIPEPDDAETGSPPAGTAAGDEADEDPEPNALPTPAPEADSGDDD
jgi:hypothetical protein